MVFLNVRKCRKMSGCNFVGNAVCVSYYGFDFLSARLSIEMHWLISFIVSLFCTFIRCILLWRETVRQMSESRPPFNKHVHQAWVLGRIIEPILQLFIWVCWSGALPQKLALSVLSGESQAQHEMLSPLQIKKKKKKLQSSICYLW